MIQKLVDENKSILAESNKNMKEKDATIQQLSDELLARTPQASGSTVYNVLKVCVHTIICEKGQCLNRQ